MGQNEDGFRSITNQMEWLLFLADKHKVANVNGVLSGHIDEFTRWVIFHFSGYSKWCFSSNSEMQELQNQLPKDTGRMNNFINSDYVKLRLEALASDLKIIVERFQVGWSIRLHDSNSISPSAWTTDYDVWGHKSPQRWVEEFQGETKLLDEEQRDSDLAWS